MTDLSSYSVRRLLGDPEPYKIRISFQHGSCDGYWSLEESAEEPL